MKIHEINLSGVLAWSPFNHPLTVATGGAAGALDSSFSTSHTLSLYSVDEPSSTPKASVSVPAGFQKLAWSSFGIESKEHELGVLVGGLENGVVDFWNPALLLQDNSDKALIHRAEKHKGPVKGLEFNPFQNNLLASGSIEGEIFIWDLNNITKPYTPGTKSQRLGDVSSLAWNKQVSHILASTSINGYTVIWDLRNKKELMTLVNPTNKQMCTCIAWNPELPTQIITSSEDDNDPSLLVWDVRNARAPERILSGGHTRGVLALSWSTHDSGLLLSAGKDNRTICWKPQTGEVLGDLEVAQNWVFDVQWCPTNPLLVSTCSFDENISIHALTPTSNSHSPPPNSDPFATSNPELVLKTPPKWMKNPVGASFGFGGKLVSFSSVSKPGQPPSQKHTVTLSSIQTDQKFISESDTFEEILDTQQYQNYCSQKNSQATNDEERQFWTFLNLILQENSREEFAKHLGFTPEELQQNFSKLSLTSENKGDQTTSQNTQANQTSEEKIEDTNSASELFPQDSSKSGVEFDFSQEYLQTTDSSKFNEAFSLFSNEDQEVDQLITKALLISDFKLAVDICFSSGKYAEGLVVAACGGAELLTSTQKRFLNSSKSPSLRIVSAIMCGDLADIVSNANISDWKSILAFICTSSPSDQFNNLCDMLGQRLMKENHSYAALLTYLCSRDLQNISNLFQQKVDITDPYELQNFIEKITLIRIAANETGPTNLPFLQIMFAKYAELLANQGRLNSAMKYLALTCQDFSQVPQEISIITDRVFNSGSIQFNGLSTPPFPFEFEHPQQQQQQIQPQYQTQTTQTKTSNQTPYWNQQAQAPIRTQAQQSYQQPTQTYQQPIQQPYQQPYQPQTYQQPIQQPVQTYQQPYQPAQTYQQPIQQPPPTTTTAQQSPPLPQKTETWNDAPYVAKKNKSSTTTTPIYSPLNTSPNNPNTPPFNQTSTSFQTPPRPQDKAAIGPPKGGFQREQEQQPMSQPSILPNPNLIPAPSIIQAQKVAQQQQQQQHPQHYPPQQQQQFPPHQQFQQQHQQHPQQFQQNQQQFHQQPQQFQQLPPQQHQNIPQQQHQQPPPQQQQIQQQYQQPPQQIQQQQPPAEKKAPPKKKVTGDKSKIPKEQLPIVNSLTNVISRLEKVQLTAQNQKLLQDSKKKVDILYDKLNDGEVPAEVVSKVLELTQALEQRRHDVAQGLYLEIFQANSGAGVSSWLVSLKQLIHIDKSS